MTADLDLSPEAVERLAKRHALHVSSKYPTAATLRALSAENTRLRAERDEQRERAEEAESEITRAQEQVSAEFEGDCWKAMRNLLESTGFDWSEYSEDGVSASEAQRWIVEELDRLEAERDAAWQAGAEAMREAAARTCILSAQDIAEGDWGPEGLDMAAMLKRWIGRRSLPIPNKDGE